MRFLRLLLLPLLSFNLCASDGEGWMWAKKLPWAYSGLYNDWTYIQPEFTILKWDGSSWSNLSSSDSIGWIWVKQYPYVYSQNLQSWLYFVTPSGDDPVLYSSSKNEWFSLKDYNSKWCQIIGATNEDCKIVSKLDALTYLYFRSGRLDDISTLAKLINLEVLKILLVQDEGERVTDISAITRLPNLKELRLSNLSVSNFSSLSKLPKLKKFTYTTQTDTNLDMSSVSNLTNLTSLLLNVSEVSDISPLSNLTNLTSL